MGEGGRGGGSARPERRSREWSTCVACRNLNRIKNFGANNFDILKRVCTFHTITSPRADDGSTKTFSRIDILKRAIEGSGKDFGKSIYTRLTTSLPWGREGAGEGARDPSDEVAP
jgi:hypothetical protein